MLFQDLATMPAILDMEPNKYSNSKSPCHPNASHHVWTQSDLPSGSKYGLKTLKMAKTAAILDIGTERFYQF